jgi:hypothetical protein
MKRSQWGAWGVIAALEQQREQQRGNSKGGQAAFPKPFEGARGVAGWEKGRRWIAGSRLLLDFLRGIEFH